jgi:tripartite ATP-independent transporter DctM subunit
MTDLQIGILGLVILLILIILGMRVAYAVTIVGALGVILIQGWGPGTKFIGYLPSSEVGSYTYSAIPLFVLMGYFTYYAGIADDLFKTARAWIQHIRGGLPIATVIASAGFATVSGASTASTSVLGKIAIPQMLGSGVDKKLAAGVVAMGGCLAALIPPSTIMIVYGILTEQSISAMLIAGIIPGGVTVLIYILMIYIRARMNPNTAPVTEAASWKERFKSLKNTYAMLVLVALVIGGIYFGYFTPTEAAGIGAIGALIIALVLRKLSKNDFKTALLETTKTTAMIFLIMVGISIFIRFLALAGVNTAISNFVVSLPISPLAIIIVMLVFYLILGMFMDAISMMMLTLPIFFPVVMELGFHPIWFGILVVKMTEIGLVSPPVGLNCFVVRSVAPKIPLGQIFIGVLPFIAAEIVVVAILILVPELVTYLPEVLSKG